MSTSHHGPLILASRSPRRRQLLQQYGYVFEVRPASDQAECGVCSGESPPEMVARLAYQKALDVARDVDQGTILSSDTVAECCGQILGKPRDQDHARQMLTLMSGQLHRVYSGICLWRRPDNAILVEVDRTELRMDRLSDVDLDVYLDSDQWMDKAGAFGYQDGLDWVHIERGSETNVVGLPMELLESMLARLHATPPASTSDHG